MPIWLTQAAEQGLAGEVQRHGGTDGTVYREGEREGEVREVS